MYICNYRVKGYVFMQFLKFLNFHVEFTSPENMDQAGKCKIQEWFVAIESKWGKFSGLPERKGFYQDILALKFYLKFI